MIRGLYTAWSGMKTQQEKLDVIANNVANASTTGFKSNDVTVQSFDEQLTVKIRDRSENYTKDEIIGKMTLGVKIGQEYTNYTQGSLRETGNTYDLALEGNGFFQLRVVNANGEENMRYTRAGNFTVNGEGILMDTLGNRVQGEGGDIVIPSEAGVVAIDKDGSVYADGELVDRLNIVDFEDYKYLKKFAETMYQPVEGYTVKEDFVPTVRQGFLEASNVNVISQMTNLIALTRAYEANQKVVQTMDASMDSSNSIANVSR